MPHYTATITKYSKINPWASVGHKLWPVISSIDAEGALNESCLKKGMKLLTINNIKVSDMSSKEAVKILKETVLSAKEFVPANILSKRMILLAVPMESKYKAR